MFELSLFGIPVRIDGTFLLLMGFYAYLMGGDPVSFVSIAIAIFLAILVHEAGHAVVAIAQGRRDVSITLHGFGGLTHSTGTGTHARYLVLALGGPAAGLMFGVAALALQMSGVPLPGSLPVLVGALVFLNFFWTAFNLLPIYPMDGGQALGHFLAIWWPSKAWSWTFRVGVLGSGGLILWGLSIGSIFIPLFGVLFAVENYRRLQSGGW